MRLYFASHNPNKLHEIKKILPSYLDLKSLDDLGLSEEIVEDGETIEANSIIKAKYVYDRYQVACFADDTGLEVEALGGAPGVYSARYAGEHKSSEENMALLLERLKGHSNRKAQFKTIITLIDQNGQQLLFEGIAKGTITPEKKGIEGFGYDPIFMPEGYAVTFAEMELAEKNKISHRAQAFQKLITYLEDVNKK